MAGTGIEERMTALAALGDPLRRDLYRFAASAPDAVSRDQAAGQVGVSRAVAAFHLDKLADLGLLEVEYRRPPGRRGPGAGRPAKFYRPSRHDLAFSIPPRDYELAAWLLAEALTVSDRERLPVSRALRAVAREFGQSLAREVRARAGERPSRRQLVEAASTELRDRGYEPRREAGGFTLANCPFHALALEYRDLVCGMNLELMSGLTESLEEAGLVARLEPSPGRCCVRLTRAGAASA